MIYDLTLKIAYDYPAEVKDARHILRIRPRVEPGQHVRSARVVIEPGPDETSREADFFGNALDHVLILPGHEKLSVSMRARVETHRPPPDLKETPSVGELLRLAAAARDAGGGGPMHFLGDSRIIRLTRPMTDYVATTMTPSEPAGVALLDLCRRVQREFKYAPGKTTVDTAPEEAFARKEGVCQDFAHIVIAGLRGMGVPAAYVSGFIRTIPPKGRPRLAGADAMHAWINVWLGPTHGWRGFDPTNGMLALDDHVVVAVGRDYSDVAPIDGVLITSGPQKTRHSVDLVPVEV